MKRNSRSATTDGRLRSSRGVKEDNPRREGSRSGDLTLVAAARRGDEAAVDALVTRMVCIPRIIRTLDRLRDGALGFAGCDDAQQESRLRIWRDLASFDGTSKLETWMYRYCFNVYRELLRRKNSASGARLMASPSEPHEMPCSESDVPTMIQEAQQRRLLWQGVDDLPDREREVVALKHVDDFSFTQMAQVTGVSINTLKARYYKACRTLKVHVARASGKDKASPPSTTTPGGGVPR